MRWRLNLVRRCLEVPLSELPTNLRTKLQELIEEFRQVLDLSNEELYQLAKSEALPEFLEKLDRLLEFGASVDVISCPEGDVLGRIQLIRNYVKALKEIDYGNNDD